MYMRSKKSERTRQQKKSKTIEVSKDLYVKTCMLLIGIADVVHP